MNISIFYEKQNSSKIIRELTYNIGNLGAELKRRNKNRIGKDLIKLAYDDAKQIKKEIQINNEDFYYLYIYLNVFSKDKRELKYLINRIEGACQNNELKTRVAICRQEQAFFACTPIMENSLDIKTVSKKNILTSGIISTYPFITSSIFDPNGILNGINLKNNSLILINKFNFNKYKNSNMFILGTSGAGKSYYTKLMILRNRLFGIEQYIIDPEREYTKLCQNLDGTIIKIGPNSNTYINVLEIRQESLEEGQTGYLVNKTNKLIGFFNLIFGSLTEIEKAILEEKIIKCYLDKEITFNDKSLFNEKVIQNKRYLEFKNSKQMPLLEDLYNLLKSDTKTNNFATKLLPYINGYLKFFNNYTNIKLNNKLIVADIYELDEDILKCGMYAIVELFWDKIKTNRQNKKIIYFDEIWRLIGVTSNKYVASFIYKIFKTIRKYGGGACGITQDITDMFSLKNGIYGKSILNNSEIKAFFYLEQENIEILNKYLTLSQEEIMEIKKLKRGECLIHVGKDKALMKVDAMDFEKDIIE